MTQHSAGLGRGAWLGCIQRGESSYPQTRKWAAAADAPGFERIAWRSKRSEKYQVHKFYGDRVLAAPERSVALQHNYEDRRSLADALGNAGVQLDDRRNLADYKAAGWFYDDSVRWEFMWNENEDDA